MPLTTWGSSVAEGWDPRLNRPSETGWEVGAGQENPLERFGRWGRENAPWWQIPPADTATDVLEWLKRGAGARIRGLYRRLGPGLIPGWDAAMSEWVRGQVEPSDVGVGQDLGMPLFGAPAAARAVSGDFRQLPQAREFPGSFGWEGPLPAQAGYPSLAQYRPNVEAEAGTIVALGKGGGGQKLSPDEYNRRLALVGERARGRFGDEGARAAMAVVGVEGGLGGAVGDAGRSFGAFQFHIGGQLPNFARSMKISTQQAAQLLQEDPLAGVDWALDNYLGSAIKRGMEMGLRGPALATYAQRYGQVSQEPQRAGLRWMQLFGGVGAGQDAPAAMLEGADYWLAKLPDPTTLDPPPKEILGAGYTLLETTNAA